MEEAKVERRKLAKDVSYVDAYMDEFYSSLTRENAEIGEFVARATAASPDHGRPSRIVDVACGPSALYWALFTRHFDERYGVDARTENVEHLLEEIRKGKYGAVPERYLDVVRAAAGAGGERNHFQRVCESFKSMVAADLLGSLPFVDGFADVVTSIFGVEHLETISDFRHSLAEVRRILKPGGRFVIVSLSVASTWLFRGDPVHVLSLTHAELRSELALAGFVGAEVERRAATTAIERSQGYDAMIFGSAAKPL